MGLTVTPLGPPLPLGDRYLRIHQIGFDSSFASGGEALTRRTLGFGTVTDTQFCVITPGTGGYVLEYDYTNQKLLAYMQSDSDNDLPLAAATAIDLSLLTTVIVAIGRYLG